MLDALARAERVLIPMTVLGELEAAFELGSRARENRRALEEFIGEPFVDLLDTTASVARHYGRVFSALKRAGTPLPVNDIWIAGQPWIVAARCSPSIVASSASAAWTT